MKLTKTRLMEIIKEEIRALTDDQVEYLYDPEDPEGERIDPRAVDKEEYNNCVEKGGEPGMHGECADKADLMTGRPPLKYIELSDDDRSARLALGNTGGKSDGEIQKALFALGVYHPDKYDRSNSGNTFAIWEPDDAMGETVEDFVYRMSQYDNAWIKRAHRSKPVTRNESRQKIKLTKTRLMEIIKEETRVFLEDKYRTDDPTYQRQLARRMSLRAQDTIRKAKREREAAEAEAYRKKEVVGDELYDLVWDNFDPDLDLKTNINTILKIIDDGLPEVKAGLDGDFGPGTTEQGVIDIVKDLKGIREGHIKEVSTPRARRYMCAMKDKEADERPDGLSQDDAEEMCHAPLKEEEALPANVNVAKPEIKGSEDKALETLIKQLVQYAAESDLNKGKTASLAQKLSDHLSQGGDKKSAGDGSVFHGYSREELKKTAAEGGEMGGFAQSLLDSQVAQSQAQQDWIKKKLPTLMGPELAEGADHQAGAVQITKDGDEKIYYKFLENKKITKARLMEIIKEEIDEGLFGLGKSKDQGPKYAKYPDIKRSSVPMDAAQAGNVENLLQKVAEIINIEKNNPESSPETKQLALKQAQHLMAQAVFHRVLEEEDLEEGWFGNKTKKQTDKTLAMTQHADKTLGRFGGEKEKKLKPSPDEEASDDAYAALLQKMKASGQLQEEE